MSAGDKVRQTVQKVDRAVPLIKATFEGRASLLYSQLIQYRADLAARADLRIAKAEAPLIRAQAALVADAEFHTMRAYWHASPSLILILGAIWTAITFVWKIIKVIADVLSVIKATGIDTLLYNTWEAYRQARDNLTAWISGVSKKLGWGIDGLNALLSSVMGISGIVSGITGKEREWGGLQFIIKSQNTLQLIANNVKKVQEDPSFLFNIIADQEFTIMRNETAKWLSDVTKTIQKGADIANTAVAGVKDVFDNLQDFKNHLPANVAKFIPQSVWDGINNADSYINDNIVPALSDLNKSLESVNAVITDQRNRADALAAKLAKPATLLKGIDELPAAERTAEEKIIDEVTARETARQNEAALAANASTFAALDAIIAGVKPPTPQPQFLDLISVPGRTRPGIKIEPRETWMVGGYSSPY